MLTLVLITETLLAMRCPDCGKLEYHKVSRFGFSGARIIEIFCACGALKLTISTKNRKDFWLQIPCVVCEAKHLRSIPGKKLWSGQVVYLCCQETGLELGYLGPGDQVRELAPGFEDDMEALAGELGGDEYFHNSDVMYEVLNRLHDIAENSSLYCQCGNQRIEVDIFPDRLELHCKDCDSVNIIYAETDDDLRVILQVETIELTRSGFGCLDSLVNTSKPKKTRRKRNK
ncbi:MAG: hypothetical protein AB1815_01800 [Bacillota bacterium]